MSEFLEKYNKVFREIFEPSDDAELQKLSGWDSAGQMTLISALEDEFNIMFDTEDILEFDSYEKGMDIVKKYL